MRKACASLLCILVLVGVAAGLWWWRHDDSLTYDPVTGFVDDPSFFLILGKGVSEGLGYRLINQPQDAPYRTAPIGYPLIVAGVLKVLPKDDVLRAVVPIKAMNLLFFAAALAVLGVWWRRQGGEAGDLWWLGLALVAVNPLLLTLAAAIMSEVPYLFLSAAALLIVEGLVERAEVGRRALRLAETLGMALALVVPFYIRSVGASWMAAGILFLVARRRIGDAVRTLNWALVFLAPWMLLIFTGYGRRSQAILAVTLLAVLLGMVPGRLAIGGAALGVVGAGATFALLFLIPGGPGATYMAQAAGNPATIGRLLEHGAAFAVFLGAAMADGGPVPLGLNPYGALFRDRGLGLGWPEVGLAVLALVAALGWARRARERLGLVEIYVILYALLVVASPWAELRYTAPILPFAFLYLLVGLRWLAQRVARRAPAIARARWGAVAVRAGVVVLIGLALASNRAGAAWARTSPEARDADVGGPGYWRAIAWVRDSSPPESVVVSRYQGITYLYGHRWSVRYPVGPADQVVRDILERGVTIAIEDRMVKAGLTGKYLAPALEHLRARGLARVIQEFPGAYGARIWQVEAGAAAGRQGAPAGSPPPAGTSPPRARMAGR